jgi:hypothetical protein
MSRTVEAAGGTGRTAGCIGWGSLVVLLGLGLLSACFTGCGSRRHRRVYALSLPPGDRRHRDRGTSRAAYCVPKRGLGDICPDNTVNIIADNGLLLAQLVFGSRQDAEPFAYLATTFRTRRAQARGR